jgi:transposase
MQRRKFSREFKVEAVKLVRERGVSVAQAGRDLGVHENVLRKWVKEFGSDPVQAFPGHGRWHGYAKQWAYPGRASMPG